MTRAPFAFFLLLRGSYPSVWCRLMLMETIKKRTAWDMDLPWIMEVCAMVNTRSVGTRVCAHIGFVTWGPSCSQSSTWRCFTVPQRGRVNISELAKLKATNPNIKSVSQDRRSLSSSSLSARRLMPVFHPTKQEIVDQSTSIQRSNPLHVCSAGVEDFLPF